MLPHQLCDRPLQSNLPRVLSELLQGSGKPDRSLEQKDDVVRQILQLAQHMGGDHDRSARPSSCLKVILEDPAGDRIEAGTWIMIISS